VLIRDAVKRPAPKDVPFPGAVRKAAAETAAVDAPAADTAGQEG
jgi:large subunit ribosomal protein L3